MSMKLATSRQDFDKQANYGHEVVDVRDRTVKNRKFNGN